ncbi:cysteine peptidase family C39 domain-containing protein [Pleomorphovibrio marinus]|uniref:cysteine peptidase family C39 domain-containing protein n=1 Tax=Pleomorphovibrio marinus TaxID=2164132 RepID=UPI0018E53E1A
MKTRFPFCKQPDAKDCGLTCLRIIAKRYGKLISLQEIREYSETTLGKQSGKSERGGRGHRLQNLHMLTDYHGRLWNEYIQSMD